MFDINANTKTKRQKLLGSKATNRLATAMDSIHRNFKGQKLEFGSESDIVAHIRKEGGVEALIQQQLAYKRKNKTDDPDVKKEELQKN
jgi:hypothetical protein